MGMQVFEVHIKVCVCLSVGWGGSESFRDDRIEWGTVAELEYVPPRITLQFSADPTPPYKNTTYCTVIAC